MKIEVDLTLYNQVKAKFPFKVRCGEVGLVDLSVPLEKAKMQVFRRNRIGSWVAYFNLMGRLRRRNATIAQFSRRKGRPQMEFTCVDFCRGEDLLTGQVIYLDVDPYYVHRSKDPEQVRNDVEKLHRALRQAYNNFQRTS